MRREAGPGDPPHRDRLRLLAHQEAAGDLRLPAHPGHQLRSLPPDLAGAGPGQCSCCDFADRIYHVHVKDAKLNLNGRNGILGSHITFGDQRRGWNFVSPGHGDVDFDNIIRALNQIGYDGPLSIEWEDSGMERVFGGTEACAFTKKINFSASDVAFDDAIKNQ